MIWIIRALMFLSIFASAPALARDPDGRYANSPLRPWFDSLKSGRGPCCSDADGRTLKDVDWDTQNGHYRVFIENKWVVVPDEAVIKEPNRSGQTIVWPIYHSIYGGPLEVEIRCFMPGSMT